MDREALSKLKPLDPTKPEEYLEAIRRFVEIGFDEWDNLPDGDGDGENLSSDDEGVVTKTDLFRTIGGCTSYALDVLKLIHEIG